jgi:hypothetical protein
MLVEFGLSTQLANPLGGRLDVLDREEQIRTGGLIAAVQTAPDVPGLDMKAVLRAGGPGIHPPSEQLAVELTSRRRVLDAQLEE